MLTYGADYTIANSVLTLVTGLPLESILCIYRDTPTDSQVQWVDSSVLRASDLNKVDLQLLHLAEENNDKIIINGMSVDQADNSWEGLGRKVKNVADPTNDQDVVTKGYIEAVKTGFISTMTAVKDSCIASLTSVRDSAITNINALIVTATTMATTATTKASEASASATAAANSAKDVEAPVNIATPNRVLRLNANAKLPADITGNAVTATTATNAQNADKVAGLQIGFDSTAGVASVPIIGTNSIIEAGFGIDLHDIGSTNDYDLRLSVDSFAANKNSNGYQKLPSGLIIQWGWVDQSGVTTNKFIAFPITFPTACLQVIQTSSLTWDESNFKTGYTWIKSIVTSGYTVERADSGGTRFIAIGY